MMLSGWGRYPRAECRVVRPRGPAEVTEAIAASASLIARGNGRAYGDAALNPANTLAMGRNNRFIAFDPSTGTLTCEAGVLLADILDVFVPRGWFPPVLPGTKFVTVGGMIASDVHGKNHHVAGSFGDHVLEFHLALPDGGVICCSRSENAEVFAATRGGMGLTGVILDATFRLLPIETSVIRRETLRTRNLEEVMTEFEASRSWSYSVAWIDCLACGSAMGRSLLFRGEHARRDEVSAADRTEQARHRAHAVRRVPFDVPSGALNRWSVAIFNALYYRLAGRSRDLIGYEPFFFPLDGVLEWNRVYGRAGFVQYQCVFPYASSREGLTALLARVTDAGIGSFMSVLKLFGPQEGLLSFPTEGFTIALDFPLNDRSLALLAELDALVLDHGGRIYLAKDARAAPETLRRGYPALGRFAAVRAAVDPQHKFNSLLSRRLDL